MRSVAFLFSIVFLLTGCSLTPTAAPVPERGAALQGVVHGGQQPVVGAHVFLFSVNAIGYGKNSLSLLDNEPGLTTLDTSGGATNGYYYTTTDANGNFSITGDYLCEANTQVYLYAAGGNPGSGANSAAGFLAPVGTCPVADLFPPTTFITVNEVTTIATSYALAGFATDAVHISSSGTALAKQGVANAFANINNLVSSSGSALATTPSGAGTVPQALINSLANILAACINSSGSTSSACTTLFSNARSGGSTGNVPTDTATAAINIAHNPVANVSTIFAIPTPTPPFAPALPSSPVPNDLTIGLNFTGGGLKVPTSIAIDGSGNAWISNEGKPELSEISSSGSMLSGTNGIAGGDPFNYFYAIAMDTFGNAWTIDPPDSAIIEFTSAGALAANSPIVPTGVNGPLGIAFDGSGNLWIPDASTSKLSVLSSSGVPLAGYTGGGLNQPYSIAIDGSGNVWVINFNFSTSGNSVSKFSSAGVSKAGTTGYTANFNAPQSIAIDASGDAWIADEEAGILEISPTGTYLSTGYKGGGVFSAEFIAIDGLGNAWVSVPTPQFAGGGTVIELSNSGSYLSGSKGYTGGGLSGGAGSQGLAVDGSGNVWVANGSTNSVSELIGVAAPVVTPIVAGVKNNTLGTRP